MSKSGPGRCYRTGISIIELFDMFPDEESARQWFEQIRWPNGERQCPHCGSDKTQEDHSRNPQPYRCKSCWKFFSVKVGTVMEASNLPLRKWVVGYYLMTTSLKGVSSMKLHRDLGITQKSAWHMANRIREGWSVGGELLSGEIEVDETYIGGKEKNKRAHRRRGIRGPSGKAIVIGARQRNGEIRAQHIDRATGATLKGFIRENVEPGSTVYTDDHRGYQNTPNVRHFSVKHSVGEYVDGQAHVNGLESFWAMLKRGYHGTFHHLSEKHLGRYVAEFSGRQSRRDLNTLNQMALLFRGTFGRRLRYSDLIGK
ncbi:MAG: IS1595 family transposase [Chloroflexi bacterium]|nr:IS1595 family transposase [Chloroflexota bacterium]